MLEILGGTMLEILKNAFQIYIIICFGLTTLMLISGMVLRIALHND